MNAQNDSNISFIEKTINEVREKYAPDKRVSIFNITVNKGKEISLIGETNNSNAKNELLEHLNNFKIIFNEKILLLPSSDLKEHIYGVINLSVANIRTEPKHSAEMATQSLLGTPIKVYKKSKDGWYLVQTPDDYLGWIDDDGFIPLNETDYKSWIKSRKLILTNFYAPCFSRPDINSELVSDLVMGNILKFISEENEFFKIEFPDQRIGFVKKSAFMFLNDWLNQTDATKESILKTSKSFMGIPYLWGGTSCKGVDCSGFTKSIFFMNGILLPRDASQQVFVGESIDTDSGFQYLEEGDLLFFGTKAKPNQKERVTHVGIYIGNSEFIHSSGRVKINSLDKTKKNFSEYRFKTYLKAKRILSSKNKNGVLELKKSEFYNFQENN